MKHLINRSNFPLDDDENDEDNDIEIIKQQKKHLKISKSKRTSKSTKEVTTASFPEYKEVKDEDIEFVEFVLGDFHQLSNLHQFPKMTSLSLINQNIVSIEEVIKNIPVKENIIFLCLNENQISNMKSVEKLVNLEALHLNFNHISKIEEPIASMSQLKKIWLSENKITKIENLPKEIEELWLANNMIEKIPNEIAQYPNIEFLNIAGNFILDFEDIYNLQELKKLKKLYLSDINFGENPICQFSNYRSAMIHLLPNVGWLDQIRVSPEERKDVDNMYTKKYLFYKNKIRHTHKICKMIFQFLKTNKLFVTQMKLHQARFFSQRKKMLEFAKYEKEILKAENETKIEEIEKEIEVSKDKQNICFKLISLIEANFKFIKQFISNINNLSIVTNFFEMETSGNFKIESGNMNLKWTKSCIDLIKSRTPLDFFEKNKIKNTSFIKIFKILNKKSKILFDAIYDEIIEENGKFGDEKKYFDFFFLLLPKDKLNYYSILSMVFDNETDDRELFLTDCLSDIDSAQYRENKKTSFIAIICKSATFDFMTDKSKSFPTFSDNYESISSALKSVKTDKQILQITKDKINYYKYQTKGLVIPEYIIEYEYQSKEEQDEDNFDGGFVSSFSNKINLFDNYENIFNLCSKHLFSLNSSSFFDNDIVNKYQMCKFSDFNEFDNSMFFFVKNSILAFVLKCFKYQSVDEYKNDMNKICDKLKEISQLKFSKNYKVIFSAEEREKINITEITFFNCFNSGLTDEALPQTLHDIISLSESDEEMKTFRDNITEVSLAKNLIEHIDIDLLIETFPNLASLDISHNNLETVSVKQKENKINTIDISFNNISDFKYIAEIIEGVPLLYSFNFSPNPLSKSFHQFIDEQDDYLIDEEIKQKMLDTYHNLENSKCASLQTLTVNSEQSVANKGIKNFNVLFDCYSIGDEYQCFSNNKYFREKISNDNNYKSLLLSKRKISSIPIIEGQNDVQILYINLNKISKITNLTQFSSLIELHIQNNKITHIENLPYSLLKLDISNNELQSLDGISQAEKLKWLNIENNAITSIAQIISLQNLVEFYSAGNFIDNVKECYQLRQLPKLEIVDISSNEVCRAVHEIRLGMIFYCQKLKNFNRINVDDTERQKATEFFTGKLTNEILEKKLGVGYDTKAIRELDLSSLKLKDELGMFSKDNYPLLYKLNLARNLFTTFSIFGSLPSLVELNMNYNMINCILGKNEKKSNKGIYGLTSLESLELSGNSINNLSGIQNLRSLKILVLRENNINKIESINKMNDLTFLDISFNKIRNVDRTQLGVLPSLQILLCDNNFLKSINAFSKFESVQTLSFENNKIYDYSSIEKIALLENLRDFSIQNNPLTKLANYRTRMITKFEQLIKLDGIEISTEERDMIAMDIQMGEYGEDQIQNYYGASQMKKNSYSYNLQKLQDKNLKRVNFVQLDLLNPSLIPFGAIRAGSPKNVVNLPHIKPFNYKPPTSESKKRFSSSNTAASNTKIQNGLKVASYLYGPGPTVKKGYGNGSVSNKDYYGFVTNSLSGELNGKATQYIPQSKI